MIQRVVLSVQNALSNRGDHSHERIRILALGSLAYFKRDEIDLLNAPPHLVETLKAAAALGGEFTVPQLADAMSVKTNALNQRLATLLEAGAVARERDVNAERGVRYRYWTPPKQFAKPERLVGGMHA